MMLTDDQPYHLYQGDCIEIMRDMPPQSISCCLYSPPFPAVYSYNPSPADIGNSDSDQEIKIHFSYLFRGILRLMKPGRLMVVHCTQIVRYKRGGGDGDLFDFRGLLIRLAKRAGWLYFYDWMNRRNPQAQAIKTRSRELQFSGLERDRANSRGTLCDYLLVLKAPGENAVPIDSPGQVSRNQWIEWAEGCWQGIRETKTLNTEEAKSPEDTRHICAMQLDMIERLIRMYSNPGEVVFDPFTGIGSTGYVALKLGRRFLGAELKPEYHATALKNLDRAVRSRREKSRTLFDAIEPDPSPEPEPADAAEATA